MRETKMTFEAGMQRLEQIVRTMERGDAPLDDSLKLFQEGTELVRACAQMLEDAELQIKKVMTAPDGSPVLEDFADEADA
ncbi:MAG: exodeoxyribonuclease VII small subunit [Ruminococcaceae bacterium]|nr:exodeoxyribonuclease VII small subunit [Oscillospiraceae bacterium]